MTKIDFYQISDEETTFVCRLIDQVYRRGHHIYVHTVGQEQAKALDDHLWVFREDTFIPHALQETGIDAPIKIGCDHEPFEHQDVLINLSSVVPHFFPALIGLRRWSRLTKIGARLPGTTTPFTSSEATH